MPAKKHAAVWDKHLQTVLDPETTAEALQSVWDALTIAHSSYGHTNEDALWEAIARNPNTPPDILAQTVERFPRAFGENPVAPLLLLENPAFLETVSPDARLRLLMQNNAPAPLVWAMASKTGEKGAASELQNEARQHVSLHENNQSPWPDALQEACREVCQKTKSLSKKQYLADYAELNLLPPWPETNATLPPIENHALSFGLKGYNDDAQSGAVLASLLASGANPDALLLLAQNEEDRESSAVLIALCLYEGTPASVLHEITRRENTRLRVLAAAHPNADASLLETLASDPSPYLRRMVRRHSNATRETFEIARAAALDTPGDTPLWYLVSAIYGKLSLDEIRKRIYSPHYLPRLSAVLAIGNGRTKLSDTRRDLMAACLSDGNRFVQAAAQTFLDNPDFRFVW